MNIFDSIKLTKPNKSSFDLSHDVKMSLKFGMLAPTMCLDVLPGDKFNISCDSLIRMAPLASPVFHRMDARMEYYYVPNRLLWENWQKFISNIPADDIPGHALPAVPFINVQATGTNYTELMDYLGIPNPQAMGGSTAETINAMPFAAYQFIYNEYYRDQNMIESIPFKLEDGDNTALEIDITELRYRAWEHDYFTSALPFAQKGEAVGIPMIMGDSPIKKDTDPATFTHVEVPSTGIPGGGASPFIIPNQLSSDPGTLSGELYADNSASVSQTSITDLRRATKLQEWLEKIARGGSRMTEVIRTFFGVKSSDQRLDRPEYIYGTKSPVIISEVLSTAETAANPQGNMAGHGVSVINGNHGSYYVEEHGYIIGIMSVMPKTAYQQGIPKHFLKYNNPFEWYWPQFANIGEQPIQNRELYAYDTTVNGDATFGYIPRYAEYKFMSNRVAGAFRYTLDFWTMCRIFDGPPALNEEFITLDGDSDNVNRIFAVTDPSVEKLYAHILHKIRAIRPMSKFGTPMF